jgi:hypothetical protein
VVDQLSNPAGAWVSLALLWFCEQGCSLGLFSFGSLIESADWVCFHDVALEKTEGFPSCRTWLVSVEGCRPVGLRGDCFCTAEERVETPWLQVLLNLRLSRVIG